MVPCPQSSDPHLTLHRKYLYTGSTSFCTISDISHLIKQKFSPVDKQVSEWMLHSPTLSMDRKFWDWVDEGFQMFMLLQDGNRLYLAVVSLLMTFELLPCLVSLSSFFLCSVFSPSTVGQVSSCLRLCFPAYNWFLKSLCFLPLKWCGWVSS